MVIGKGRRVKRLLNLLLAGLLGLAGLGLVLDERHVFFVEPLGDVNPTLTDEVAICLDIDYMKLKYPYGMINTLDPSQALVEHNKRVFIKDKETIESIVKTSGVKIRQTFTIITRQGTAYPARVESFAYMGNSPSSIIVVANAKVKVKGSDPLLTGSRSVALRGKVELDPESKIRSLAAGGVDEKLKQRMIRACTASFYNEDISYTHVLPAQIDKTKETEYFISFWHHPRGDFDLEDYKSACCLITVKDNELHQLPLPGNFEPKAVFDLDGDGFAEIFGTAGDAAEVCHYLLSYDGSEFNIIRKGLCAGY